MHYCTGWMLDLYPDQTVGGMTIWIISQTGKRLRLHQKVQVTFSASGPPDKLRTAWRWLRRQPVTTKLDRGQGHDLFLPEPITLLTIQVDIANQSQLYRAMEKAFPDLDYYDADIQPALHHAVVYHTFPLCFCNITYDVGGEIVDLHVLDSPWDIDLEPTPLRILHMEPDVSPGHTTPGSILVYDEADFSVELPLQDTDRLLHHLANILVEKDPDILITAYGDTWMLPLLLKKSHETGVPLPLNRDPHKTILYKKEKSYFSYGQIVYNGPQVHLAGRIHLDQHNSFLLKNTDLPGVLESARVTALPIQTSARTSPGTGINSMQIMTALRNHILVPAHKQQVEGVKSGSELIRYDQGGLVYQPIIGLRTNVAELDFISMYPSIMVLCNISPETPRPTYLGSDEPPGLVPQTLKPLLEKRVAIKLALGKMPLSDPRYKRYQAVSSAYKWLLVTCFGYLGYKNAKFGRIESHESVTTWGREVLLTAKEVAEDMGYEVLHMYVDALWVRKQDTYCPDQLTPLLDAIVERTGLSIALDGLYRWIAFLPSKTDAKVSVPNRYFGIFQDGSIKYRGIELRRRDMPTIVKDTQARIIKILTSATSKSQIPYLIHQAEEELQRNITRLMQRNIPMESLIISQKLSRDIETYKSPSPAARAAKQLQSVGKTKKPGQKVKFIFVRTPVRVHAWDMPEKPTMDMVDMARYKEMVLRAAKDVMRPFYDAVNKDQTIGWINSGVSTRGLFTNVLTG
jgi:DNA polymerase II